MRFQSDFLGQRAEFSCSIRRDWRCKQMPAKSVTNMRLFVRSKRQADAFHQVVKDDFRLLADCHGAASIGARFTVLPRGGSPRSVQYIIRLPRSRSRSMGSGKLS